MKINSLCVVCTIATAIVSLAACDTGEAEVDDAVVVVENSAPPAPPATSLSMDTDVAPGDSTAAGTATESNALQASSPDHLFLQRMSDHHVGLIQMGEQAMRQATNDSVKTEAQHFAVGQTSSIKNMQRMLHASYNDSHQPVIMPRHTAVVDSLSTLQGTAYNKAFVQKVIDHHQGGIKMIDGYLSTAQNISVRVMAEKMKTLQTEDIKRLEGLLKKL